MVMMDTPRSTNRESKRERSARKLVPQQFTSYLIFFFFFFFALVPGVAHVGCFLCLFSSSSLLPSISSLILPPRRLSSFSLLLLLHGCILLWSALLASHSSPHSPFHLPSRRFSFHNLLLSLISSVSCQPSSHAEHSQHRGRTSLPPRLWTDFPLLILSVCLLLLTIIPWIVMLSTVTSLPSGSPLSASSQLSESQPMLPSPATSDLTSTSILDPSPALGMRPTSHSFSLQRPLLAEEVKRTRNSKRLSLLVPPSPGKIETLATIAASANSPLFPQPSTPSFSSPMPSTPRQRRAMALSAPISLPTTSSENTRRQSQLWLDQALPSPRIPLSSSNVAEIQQQQRRRPISAYFADFSVECGAASPYTTQPVSVLPHLYLGAEHNAMDASVLTRLGITGVLNVAVEIAEESAATSTATGSTQLAKESLGNVERPDNNSDSNSCHWKQGIQYKSLAWSHHQRNLLAEFPEAFEFIDRIRTEGGKVLVHCQLGVSRSASLVIAYVMQSRGMGLNEAYDFVKARSAVISPNMSLMYQLAEFEKTQRSSKSVKAPGIRRGEKDGNPDTDADEESYPYPTEMDSEMSSNHEQSAAQTLDTTTAAMAPSTPIASTFSVSSTVSSASPLSSNVLARVATRPRSSHARSILVPVPHDILRSPAREDSLSVSTTRIPDSPTSESQTALSPPIPLFFSEGISNLPSSNSPSSTCSLSSFTTSNYSRPSSTSSISSVITVPTLSGGSGSGAAVVGALTKNVTKAIVIPTTAQPQEQLSAVIIPSQNVVVTSQPLIVTEAPMAIPAPQLLHTHRPSLPVMASPQARAKRVSLHQAYVQDTSTGSRVLSSESHPRPHPQHLEQKQHTHASPSSLVSLSALPPTRSHTLATVLTRPWSSFHNTHLSQQDSVQTQPPLQHYPLYTRQSSNSSTMMASGFMNQNQDTAAGVGGATLFPSTSSPAPPLASPSSRIRAITVDGSESFGGKNGVPLRGIYSADQNPSESIFSPRPFSPPPPSLMAAATTTTVDQVSALANRNRSFGGFYQSLRMEG